MNNNPHHFKQPLKPCHFVPNYENPDWETKEGKWWLCEKGKKCSVWRFDSKLKDYRAFLLLANDTGQVLEEKYTIDGIGFDFEIYEAAFCESEKKKEK